MKRVYLPFAILAVAATLGGQAVAAEAMANMKGMSASTADPAKTGQATGVVIGLDAKAGAVTIKHGAIPALGWPAMTMTFKANPAALLKGVKPGQKVAFTVKVKGQDNEVTALRRP